MPVKFIHWRYVFLVVEGGHDPNKLIDIFRSFFGIYSYSMSGLRLVDIIDNIAIYAVSSRYVPQLVAASVIYSELYGEKILLRGVAPTLKSGKKIYLPSGE